MPEMNHDHWWSKWYPYDKKQVYRQCQHPNCSAIETQKAMA